MKKLIILTLLYSNLVTSQITFNIQSNFGYKYLELTNILPTDSCYYITGVITDTTNQQAEIGSLFLKISLTGDTLLTKNLIVPSKHYLTWNTGLFNTPDGNLATAGETPDKIFFMKYTPEGDTQFVKEYINPNFPMETFITANNLVQFENGYYLTGIFLLSESIVQPDIVVLKLDESGNVLQEKTYGNNTTELIGSTLVESDGGLIIGSCKTNYNYVLKNFFNRAYIFGVDSLGNVLWEYQSPTGQLWDFAKSMVKTSDGGLVVASGKGIEHPVNAEQGQLRWQGYIFKLNASHQFVWGRELRGTRHAGSPSFAKIVPATDGTGFVTYGRVGENISTGSEVYGSWIVKLSNQGDSLWARYYSVFDDNLRSPTPADFKATPDGGYIVSGHTEEGLETFGWLMKLDSFGCLIPGCNANDGPNATTEGRAGASIAIYPNPTSDYLNFQLRGLAMTSKAEFRIVNAEGKVMEAMKTPHPDATFTLPVRDWEAGVYYLQYMEENTLLTTTKFVVSH
ncbi:MAG: T9SS type A sorting domain-containing protein [Saprospiraceae bacterium]|nr:T9SS type A sorting domain-containing protein [Saprospiraceae bacterium]MCF8251632.1 T9SS type A sorting domain-containing protein [Saprospiraceae bacterium]MCF8281353.1 T9SS type A sorting domain-containing protein [Bacteroidales bacterium]